MRYEIKSFNWMRMEWGFRCVVANFLRINLTINTSLTTFLSVRWDLSFLMHSHLPYGWKRQNPVTGIIINLFIRVLKMKIGLTGRAPTFYDLPVFRRPLDIALQGSLSAAIAALWQTTACSSCLSSVLQIFCWNWFRNLRNYFYDIPFAKIDGNIFKVSVFINQLVLVNYIDA